MNPRDPQRATVSELARAIAVRVVQMVEHTAPGLPPMLDIWRSGRD